MKFNPKATLAALGITSLAALIPAYQAPYTAPHEGLSLSAYLDSVAKPTICYGKTKGVRMGMTMTQEQCERYLNVELKEHCQVIWDKTDPNVTPVGVFIATCDWIYQYGGSRYSSSTIKRKYERKDFQGLCIEFPRWKYAGGLDCSLRLNNCYGVWTRGLDREALCNASV